MGLCASKDDSNVTSPPAKRSSSKELSSYNDVATDPYVAANRSNKRPGRMSNHITESPRDEYRPSRVRRDEQSQLKSTSPSSSSRQTTTHLHTRTLDNISSSSDEDEDIHARVQGGRINSGSSNHVDDVHLEEPMFGDEPRAAYEAFDEVRREPKKPHKRMRSRQNSLLAQQKRKQRLKDEQQKAFENEFGSANGKPSKTKSKKSNARKASTSKTSTTIESSSRRQSAASPKQKGKKPFSDKKKVARYNKINARLNKMRSRNKALKLTKDKQVLPPEESDDDSDY